MKRPVQCPEHQESPSNFRIIRRYNRYLAPAASETLPVPSRRRILYRKIQHFALRLSLKFSGNAAPTMKSDSPTSLNIAPATKNDSHDWSLSDRDETLFTMRGATLVTVQHHQILSLPRNSEFKIWARNLWIASANIKTIRRHSEHDPRI